MDRVRETLLALMAISVVSCGGSGGGGSATGPVPAIPVAPTSVSVTAGNQQVSLAWSASSGATSYHAKRATVKGGPYTQIGAPASPSFTDAGLTNGTAYYYVVSALNSAGESANSAEVSATPVGSASVHVTVNVLDDRHPISPYVYGGASPKGAATIADSGLTVVRWGGNATSRYNWKAGTYNAASDWYFEDFGYAEIGDSDSAKFIQDVKAAGSNPLMTMVMLNWVAKGVTGGSAKSFSVAKYGPQCNVDPYNSDAGSGVKTDCSTNITGNDPNDANMPLLDTNSGSDPAGSIYRDQWVATLAPAFGSAPHFYDMDNEPDIWGGTHRDVHPNPSSYSELRDVYIAEARALKIWDPQAIRLGPVSCCWWFYWNGANNNDKAAHAGVDFLPWWLNEVYWSDQVTGVRSLDVFDFHAYPDAPDTSSYTLSQKQALATRIYRDYWDPTYVSESGSINQQYATHVQPNKTIPFRIPRMRALLNAVYPGTPMSITEWSAEFAGASDFSTALGDADAYGILGRERVYLASRWTAPDPAHPNYQALKLFTNYDGQHHGFGSVSAGATNDADPNLFSSYAALNSSGTVLMLLVINKDPQNNVQTGFALNGFTPGQVTTYTLTAAAPTIVAPSPQAWSATASLSRYSATLFVISGAMSQTPSVEWDLNPDTIMVPAGGSATLQPKIISGSGSVTLGSPQSDSGIAVTATQPNLTATQNGTVTVTAGNTPGFYHYTVPGTDNGGVTQNQGGWIVVGNPPATFTKTGDGQTGGRGTTLTLSVALNPGSSGGSGQGASVLFSTDAGSLSNRIVVTDGSGTASVILTLPGSPGTVHVTAEGPIALGHPTASFTETAQ